GGECPPYVLAVRGEANQGLIGIVPLYVDRQRCLFPMARGRVLATSQTKMVTLASGRLLLPPGDHWLDDLFATLAHRHPERPVLKIENIPVPSPLHTYLNSSPRIRACYFLHSVPAMDRVQTISLPLNYDEFLARYNAKK